MQKGFSLVELMIVVVIIGVISAIAIPSYTQHVKKTRRVEAQAALLELANAIERHRLRTGTYLGVASNKTEGTPRVFQTQVPFEAGATKTYDLRITFGTTSYTAFAIPVAAGPQKDDGRLCLDHFGERLWNKGNNAACVASNESW